VAKWLLVLLGIKALSANLTTALLVNNLESASLKVNVTSTED
jgi:hypothetical protein